VKAPEKDVLLSTGETVPLKELYKDKSLVLVFLRHFGCTFCREQVSQLRSHKNWNITLCSMASPEEAEEFRQKLSSPHPFICDPDQELYQAFGLKRGKAKQMFNPRVFMRGFGATFQGHLVGKPIGDPWQMPGVFLIEPDGTIAWHYRSVDASDNAPPELIKQHLET
jgi:peroxiredoxin